MDSPIGIAQPWTPPETDTESSPRADYFSNAFRKLSLYKPTEAESARCDTPTEDQQSRPKLFSAASEPAPYTPTKNLGLSDTNTQGALRYPYTPESSRILRRSTELPSSHTPWDDYSVDSSSPVQNALSSCIAHFEDLIQTRQPDEDQMEYVVGQFEAMASYLSTPPAQTKTADEHLFSDAEPGLCVEDIGEHVDTADANLEPNPAQINQEYVAGVERYIKGVQRYIEDLKMRLDEVKTLNSIQLDVIQDLRGEMKTIQQEMQDSLDMTEDFDRVEDAIIDIENIQTEQEHDGDKGSEQQEFGLESWETLVDSDLLSSQRNNEEALKGLSREAGPQTSDSVSAKPRRRLITIIRKPERRSFWASFGEALDTFGESLLDH